MKANLPAISLFRKPSAWIPLAMSLIALTMVLTHAAIFGVIHEADEGAAAHIFQILVTAQLPVVAYFAFKWLSMQPINSMRVLALQATAWLSAIAAAYWLT